MSAGSFNHREGELENYLCKQKVPPALNSGPGSTLTFQEEGGREDKQPVSALEEVAQTTASPSCPLSGKLGEWVDVT